LIWSQVGQVGQAGQVGWEHLPSTCNAMRRWVTIAVMAAAPSENLLRSHHAFVKSDNKFQRSVRLRQALWRERHGHPIGLHRGQPLGTRLQMPDAKKHLWNYISDGIREVVRTEVLGARRSKGKLFAKPRIFDDLLSSQPLCFNLFAELRLDLVLASRVLRRLMPEKIKTVCRIGFEHSPGRCDPKYTADKSAFDVYVEYESIAGEEGFLGIEVKYHEDMNDDLALHRERYEQVARGMGCFHAAKLADLRMKPINQLWRDHMLAGSMILADGWKEGTFVVLYPAENTHAAAAIRKYQACLADASTFGSWTLESFVSALEAEGAGRWVGELRDRYLGLAPL
jgi:hypothetical protein